MKMIKINEHEGAWYVEDEELCYSFDGTLHDCCIVQDLTGLRIWEYNELVNELGKHYPSYNIECLTGRFI